MDPNSNLARQAAILVEIDGLSARAVVERHALEAELRNLQRALNAWVRAKGFRPDWNAYPRATEAYLTAIVFGGHRPRRAR